MASCPPDYRYVLTRWWGDSEFNLESCLLWIMLNPSTATQCVDDRTITRCMKLTGSQFPGLVVVNLFARRSTDAKAVRDNINWVGPGNDDVIFGCAELAPQIVLAWGSDGKLFPKRVDRILGQMKVRWPEKLYSLGLTKGDGNRQPLHPSRRGTELERFE